MKVASIAKKDLFYLWLLPSESHEKLDETTLYCLNEQPKETFLISLNPSTIIHMI